MHWTLNSHENKITKSFYKYFLKPLLFSFNFLCSKAQVPYRRARCVQEGQVCAGGPGVCRWARCVQEGHVCVAGPGVCR